MLTISDVRHVLYVVIFKRPVSLTFSVGHAVNLMAKSKHQLHLYLTRCPEPQTA